MQKIFFLAVVIIALFLSTMVFAFQSRRQPQDGTENSQVYSKVDDLLQDLRRQEAARHSLRGGAGTGLDFPTGFSVNESKKGKGFIYVIYWKETISGCFWQGLASICLDGTDTPKGLQSRTSVPHAQACEKLCCEMGPSSCQIHQYREADGCWIGMRDDCTKWTSATSKRAVGWTGGEVNSPFMVSHLRKTRESRWREMIRSVQSIRRVMHSRSDDYGISVISPKHYADRLEPRKKQELRHLGVRLIEVAVPAELPPDFHSSWWFRTLALPSTPYEYTVQLDSDTVMCSSVEAQQLWKLLGRYEYAATHAPSLFHDSPDPDGPVSLAMAQYNDAVIAYRYTRATRQMLIRAINIALMLPAYGLRDQAAYRPVPCAW